MQVRPKKSLGQHFLTDLAAARKIADSLQPDGVQVQMDLDFFAYHEDDDTYTRTSESFCERAYTDGEIRQFIEKSGLKLVAAYAADSFNPVEEKTQRIVYVAQK